MEDNVVNQESTVNSPEVQPSVEQTTQTDQSGSVQTPEVKPNEEAKPTEDLGSLKSQWEEKEKSFTSQLQEHKTKVDELSKYKEDYYSLLDQYTGKSVFANETIRKQNEILKKFPDKDPSVINEILSKNDLSDTDALVLADKLSLPLAGVTDKDRLDAILDGLGVSDEDLNALEGKDKVKFRTAVAKAKQQLSELTKTEISDNGQFDIEAAKKARLEQSEAENLNLSKRWTPVNQILLKSFDGFKQEIKDEKGNVVMEYKYQADDKFKQEYASELNETLIGAKLQPTEENYQLVNNLINNQFKIRNFDKIVNDVYKQLRTKMEDEYHAKIHNDSPTQHGLNQASGDAPKGKTLQEHARS